MVAYSNCVAVQPFLLKRINMERDFLLRRNVVIDMLRALTMFVMIFVNDFWKIHDVPHFLDHARFGEDFLGVADVVFPLFLFAVGLSIPYAIASREAKNFSFESTLKHIFSRTVALFIMGLFITNSEYRLDESLFYSIGVYWLIMVVSFIGLWNYYSKEMLSRFPYILLFIKICALIGLLFLAFTFRSKTGEVFGEYWGILGTIGWCYLICSLLYLLFKENRRILIGILALFLLINLLVTPLNDTYGAIPLVSFPEGNLLESLLRTFKIGNGALLTCTMAGVLFTLLLREMAGLSPFIRRSILLFIALVMAGLGIGLNQFWIISKMAATPPWVLLVLAIGVLFYLLLDYLVETNNTGWFKLIKPAGTATLTAYLVPYVFYGLSDITGIVLPDFLTHGYMGLANCLIFSFVVIATTALLGKYSIKLKI